MRTTLAVLMFVVSAFGAGLAPPCGSTPYALTSAGWEEGCESGDKLFDNFTYDPGTSGVSSVPITFLDFPGTNQHWVLFSGGWSTGTFSITYWVTVLNPDPLWKVVAAELGSSSFGPGTSTITQSLSDGGTIVYTEMTSANGATSSTVDLALRQFKVEIRGDTTGRFVSVVSNGYSQSAIPESATMVLIGSGLLLLGFGRRRMGGHSSATR